jgi:hypothetical protein
MQTLLSQYSTILLLIGIVLALLALSRTIRLFNQARRAPYYIIREEAARSAWRWAAAAFALVAATFAIVIFAAQAGPAAPAAEPTPSATLGTPVPTLGSTATPRATATPETTPTLEPSATPPPPPTATIAPDVPPVLITPIPGAVAPDPAAQFEFLTLASRVDADLNPLDPGLQFPTGTSRVYVIFRATGVNDGALWGVFCYRDGAIFDQFVGLWDDGPNRQTARAFCAHDGSAGLFVVRAYLGTNRALEIQYSLVAPAAPPPDASPTPAP